MAAWFSIGMCPISVLDDFQILMWQYAEHDPRTTAVNTERLHHPRPTLTRKS